MKTVGGIPTVDVRMRDMKWTIVVKQRKCQTKWKDNGVGWSGREYQRQLIVSRRQRQETCYIEMALERWSCRESSVVSVE